MKTSRKKVRAIWPPLTSWLLVPLLLLSAPCSHAFWHDSLPHISRVEREPISSNQGRTEDTTPYYCKTAGVLYGKSGVDAVVVWNRPDSFVTLAFALYYGRDCTATRARGQRALPQVIMVLDKSRLRGLHIANLANLGISPECKSWQAVKVQEELLPGGALAGLNVEELPGSVVYWDADNNRQVVWDAIKFINAIEYERIERRRQIGHFLRAVLELEVGFGTPDAPEPVPEDLRRSMELLNTQLGLPSGAEIWNPPVDSLPGGAEDLQLGVADGYVARAPLPHPDLENRLARALNLGAFDGSMTLDEIVNQPVPMDELLDDFDDVPELPAAKELWYRRIEARMMFNLRVLTNCWRIWYAWQQARDQVLSEQGQADIAARRNQQNEGNLLIEGSPQEEDIQNVQDMQEVEEEAQAEDAQPAEVAAVPQTRAIWRLIENPNQEEDIQDQSYRVEIEEELIEGNPMVVGKPANGDQLIEEATPNSNNADSLEVQPEETVRSLSDRIQDFDNIASQFDDDFRTFDTGLMEDFGRRFQDHEQLLRQQGLELDTLMGANLMTAFENPPEEQNTGRAAAGSAILEEDSDDDGLLSLRLRKKQRPNPQGAGGGQT
ncbi:hypothetical protein ABW21_db0206989 [Orbilia brochopaga]|nr:hypothetical protein ABW21_db0206989 [Drechslerella brochopaga]